MRGPTLRRTLVEYSINANVLHPKAFLCQDSYIPLGRPNFTSAGRSSPSEQSVRYNGFTFGALLTRQPPASAPPTDSPLASAGATQVGGCRRRMLLVRRPRSRGQASGINSRRRIKSLNSRPAAVRGGESCGADSGEERWKPRPYGRKRVGSVGEV